MYTLHHFTTGSSCDTRSYFSIKNKTEEFVKSDDAMMTAEMMSQNFMDHMDKGFEMRKPRKRYSMFKA